MTRLRAFCSLLILVAPAVAPAARAADPAPIVINITGSGPDARFVKDGAAAQGPVAVQVGQVVRWVNKDTVTHTATSSANNAAGDPIFDTSFIRPGMQADVTFDAALFLAAAVPPGGGLKLDYICRVHPQTMQSSLTLGTPGPVVSTPTTPTTPTNPTTPTTPVTPPPAGPGHPVTIEAITDTESRWKEATVQVAVGDVVTWVNTSGSHALQFTNWASSKAALEPVGDDFKFDAGEGKNQDPTSKAGFVFYRAKVKAIPADKPEIPFLCWVHGQYMSGKLVFSPVQPDPAIRPAVATRPAGEPTPIASIGAFDDELVAAIGTDQDTYFMLTTDVNLDGRPDLVTSGLGKVGEAPGVLTWYENPGWKPHVIAKLPVPVALSEGDIDGDGFPDIVVSHNYGACIFGCKPENGKISWLKNPARFDAADADWEIRFIADLMATHRLHLGHYTQAERLELMALPVVGGAGGKIHDPIKTTIYTRPFDVLAAPSWPGVVANDTMRTIHDYTTRKFRASAGSRLDSSLIAGEEGITWLYFGDDKKWHTEPIGPGVLDQVDLTVNRWAGSGSVDVVKHGGDPFAYVATTGPLHGNTLMVYTKDTSGSLDGLKWKEKTLDVFGPVNPTSGEGPCHFVVAADFDGGGDEEFLVALRGPMPYQGVYLYKAVDPARGKFVRQRVASISTARVAVADFDGDGRVDFATVPYKVPSYFEATDPAVMVYYNRIPRAGKPAGR